MKRAFRVAALAWGGLILICLGSTATLACSPPFEEPTIRALGPDQVVIVGTVGPRVEGGRAFAVQRWFNGGDPESPIVIAFKEGQPVGDCSYPVSSGAELIIAPDREADGSLSANLGTLQADPSSDEGQRYLAEATALFGAGVVPLPAEVMPTRLPAPDDGALLALAGAAVAVGLATAVVLRSRGSRPRA